MMENFYIADKADPLVIVLTGIAKSGKTQAGKYLNSKLGLGHSNLIEGKKLIHKNMISDGIKKKYKAMGIPVPREEYTKAVSWYYTNVANKGENWSFAKMAIDEYLSSPRAIITILSQTMDKGDIKVLQEKLENCMFIGLTADRETIISRMMAEKRGNGWAKLSEPEKRKNAEDYYDSEMFIFRPNVAHRYIDEIPVGYTIDTSGQEDTKELEQKLDGISSMIEATEDMGRNTRNHSHRHRF